MEGQDEHIIRKSNSKEVALEDDNQAVLDDLGYNADFYLLVSCTYLYFYIANRYLI